MKVKTINVETLIIGSGVAGAAVARRLVDHDPHASILVLEAGPKVKMKDFTYWQNFVTTGKLPYDFTEDLPYPARGRPGENLNVGKTVVPLQGARLMIYGGTTVHWTGWSFRLKPEDFRLKTNTGHGIDWPIEYEDLEPYYCQAEDYIGVSGDSEDSSVPRSRPYPYPCFPYTLEDSLVAEAMDSLGISHSHLPIARHGITDTTSPHAPCQTTGTCDYCPFGARYVAGNYLDDMKEREELPNLSIRINCVVEEILMSSKKVARGAVFLDKHDNHYKTVEATRVILAAGTIESAKLLLRSRSEWWPNGVGNDHDLVGRNYISHPYYAFQADLSENPRRLQPEMNFPTLCTRHFDSVEEQPKGKFVLLNPPNSPDIDLVSAMQDGQSRKELDQSVTGSTIVEIDGMVEIFSHFENRVLNYDKLNHLKMKQTVMDYSQAPEFNQRMKEIEAHVARIFGEMGAANTRQTMLSWRADHAACTARMSDDPTQGVTDKQMRIHGVGNLYVCSNASFSSLGTVNPTLTLTALALRLGDHLVGGDGGSRGSTFPKAENP